MYRRIQRELEGSGLNFIPQRDEAVIADLTERCEAVHRRMRGILRDEWEHTVVRAEEARGRNNRKRYIKLATYANDLCKAYNVLPVTHHTALLLLKNTNIPLRSFRRRTINWKTCRIAPSAGGFSTGSAKPANVWWKGNEVYL